MTTTRLLCIRSSEFPVSVPPAPEPPLRSYSAVQGAVVDALGDMSGDAAVLLGETSPDAGGGPFLIALAQSGATSARPAFPHAGQSYVDTTISKMIWWDGGSAWRDIAGNAV